MRYYVNKDTGEFLDEFQMKEQWKLLYDGDDPTNALGYEEQFEEVTKIELDQEEVDGAE